MILWRNIEFFSLFIVLIPNPDFPHFYYMLGGNLGSLLYGDVSVMDRQTCDKSEKTNREIFFSKQGERGILEFCMAHHITFECCHWS